MSETMEPDEHGNKRSHSTQATNPTREQRIRSLVDGIVQDAIEEALDNLQNEIARARISHDEVTAALGYYSDFADEWERAY
ncbi:hypothetical protein [Microbacterium enclense]|uniref:hypothetical protein n=1 Tax=Microbacterium enclense TaxID=993073 RepID=UPI00342DC477